MVQGPAQTLFPKRHTNGQQIYKKMLNFTRLEASLIVKIMSFTFSLIIPLSCRRNRMEIYPYLLSTIYEKLTLCQSALVSLMTILSN